MDVYCPALLGDCYRLGRPFHFSDHPSSMLQLWLFFLLFALLLLLLQGNQRSGIVLRGVWLVVGQWIAGGFLSCRDGALWRI
mmetsp:Transcript_104779/g.293707  ORF Transcript_104779/g.293707 Transcript_104779/m.293707 type:complete len:82 (+) Transcript_104779:116-361(+)